MILCNFSSAGKRGGGRERSIGGGWGWVGMGIGKGLRRGRDKVGRKR